MISVVLFIVAMNVPRLVTSHSLLCSIPTSTPSACVGSVRRMDQYAVIKLLGLIPVT